MADQKKCPVWADPRIHPTPITAVLHELCSLSQEWLEEGRKTAARAPAYKDPEQRAHAIGRAEIFRECGARAIKLLLEAGVSPPDRLCRADLEED